MADEPTVEEQAAALQRLWEAIRDRADAEALPADSMAELTQAWLVGAARLNQRLKERDTHVQAHR